MCKCIKCIKYINCFANVLKMYVRIYMAGIITMYPRYAEKLKIIKDHRNN